MTKYAKLRRNIIRAGLLAALVFNFQVALANYAQATPPPGWSAPTAGSSATFQSLLNKPANVQTANGTFESLLNKPARIDSAGRISTASSFQSLLNRPVSSLSSTAPTTLKLAGNAGRVMAGYIFMHPAVRIGMGVAALLPLAEIIWDASTNQWRAIDPMGDYERRVWFYGQPEPNFTTPDAACNYVYTSRNVAKEGFSFVGSRMTSPERAICVWRRNSDGQNVDSVTLDSEVRKGQGCSGGNAGDGCMGDPLDEEEFARRILNPANQPGWPTSPGWPFPSSVLDETGIPVPVDDPVINPGSNGKSQPYYIPIGDAVPNPKYDPSAPQSPSNQPWLRPGVVVVPAPVPGDPWRVDVQPVDNPPDTKDPGTDPGTGGDESDLCEKHPDILACAKPELDTPDGEIPKSQRSVELSDSDLFGGGSCPANVYATIGHQYLQVWNWDQSCYYIVKYLKPVILVLGAFTALMIVSGGTKE